MQTQIYMENNHKPICPHCGHLLRPNFRICTFCGNVVLEQQSTTQTPPPIPSLLFIWDGDQKGRDDESLYISANGSIIGPFPYKQDFSADIPLDCDSQYIDIEVKCVREGTEKQRTLIKHAFPREIDGHYECQLCGKIGYWKGWGLRLREPGCTVHKRTRAYYSEFHIGFISFCIPIYGIFKAIYSPYNRKGSIVGAVLGGALKLVFYSTL